MKPASLLFKRFTSGLTTAMILTAALVSPQLQALPSDRDKPIHISSDNADIDDAKGIAIYRGDVIMTQGTTKLTGDIITIYSKERQIQRLVSKGGKELAYYEEQQEGDKGLLKAWAVTIDYMLANNKIELIEKARLTQNGDTFTGDQIDYDQAREVVNAKGGTTTQSKGRVQMVIQPNQAPKSTK